MNPFFLWLEATPLSVWVRESTSVMAFPAILSVHAIGMGLAAGINAALALCILGVAPAVPIREFRRFVPLMWFGFWINAASGMLLLIAYPTKALTNPVFYVKISLIALALWTFRMTRPFVFDVSADESRVNVAKLKTLAVVTLASWAGAITAGRLLAYTYRRLFAGLVSMADFQIWLVHTFARATLVARLMHTKWAWPAAESIHFISLSLLVGTIFLFDLRLLGMGKRIPIAALHKLVPWGLGSYAASIASGTLFLLAEPDQYVYNPAFQWKVLFMVAAGLNASLFYLTSYRRTTRPGAPQDAPRFAKMIAVASLSLWLGVIVAGRLLTFYRPWPCGPEGPGTIAQCLPYYTR